MKSTNLRLPLWAVLLSAFSCLGASYTNFSAAIYIPVGTVHTLANPEILRNQWEALSSRLKVDKVYIEVQRNRDLASDAEIEQLKRFFSHHAVRVAGGMALSDGGAGQFRSFCYTKPEDRQFVRGAAELAARHFDEVIQDDFFFVTTKYDSDIRAKGKRSWSQFRLDLMDEAARELIIKPARAVNPRVKLVIKFPNWYEHFQGLGYDLDKEPKLFDGIYTGTETRDPIMTDQYLQQYESYLIFRYFENIKPGHNGGGWVDTYSVRYVDRYAEQLWDTLFAKAPEITLFNWTLLTHPAQPGQREAWQHSCASFAYEALVKAAGGADSVNMAAVAGQAFTQVDGFLGQLGKPIGIASYKPYQSTGEDFLHNYLGMLGFPLDLRPTFPTNAGLVLLTECAKFDPQIVAKIKAQLAAGHSVVITSGLLRALQGKGIEDIVELQCTGRKALAQSYIGGFGSGTGLALDQDSSSEILFPEIGFFTNDAWALVRALAHGKGYPLLLMDRYSQGILYVWTMPDNPNDLYRLPQSVIAAFKDHLMEGFPVRLDAPSQVALFAYDNNTFIVESFLPGEAQAKLSILDDSAHLRNLVTGEVLAGEKPLPTSGRFHPNDGARRISFNLKLPPHSYSVWAAEK